MTVTLAARPASAAPEATGATASIAPIHHHPPHGAGGGHGHAHGPSGHVHSPAPRRGRAPVVVGASMLRLSLGGRLAIAGGLLAVMWAAVLLLAR